MSCEVMPTASMQRKYSRTDT